MKKICILILSTLLLASTASARPIKFIQKLRPPNYRLYLDNAISDSQVVWKLEVAPTPDIVKNYTAWVKWKDYRVAQFEKMAPIERANTYYFSDGILDEGAASDSNNCSFSLPCLTRAKCNTLIETNNGNTRCRFAAGGVWADNTDFIFSEDNVTIDCYEGYGFSCATDKPFFSAFSTFYFNSGWTNVPATNRYTRSESNDIAYLLNSADRYGVTRGLPLIRMDSSANCEATSNSFFYDATGDVLHINLGGTDPNTLTIHAVVSNNNNGVEVNGSGVRVENLRAEGYGIHRTEVATQDQPFTVRNSGNERAYFKNLIAYYSNTHLIALNVPATSGGGWMCKNCIAGLGQVDPGSDAMSDYNSYAVNGLHETWIVDSEYRGGALPEYTWNYATDKTAGTGILSHTGGAAGGLGVAFNNTGTVFAGTRINALTDWNDTIPATADKFTTFRAFAVKDTLDVYPTQHRDGQSDRSANTIYYGMEWNMRPRATGATACFRNDEFNQNEYVFNSRYIADMTDYGNAVMGFYNGNNPTTSEGIIVNSDIIYKNWTITNGTSRYASNYDNYLGTGVPDSGNSGNDIVINTIISVDTSTWPSAGQGTQFATLGFDNVVTEVQYCAISNFKPQTANQARGFDNLTTTVQLGAAYNTPGTSLPALIDAGLRKYGLSHDFNGKRRSFLPDIGSTEY